VFWFPLQLLSATLLILRRIKGDMIKMYVCLHVKYRLFLSDFNESWIFWTDFRQKLRHQISWKSVQWESSCSMRTDGRTDRHDKADSRFLQFYERALRCGCCVLSGRGLCDELITRPGESYRLWCVVVCDLETSWMRRLWPTRGEGGGLLRQKQTN